jgi:hypothetical protein
MRPHPPNPTRPFLQVPCGELCATAPRLRHLDLKDPYLSGSVSKARFLEAIASLKALPSLEELHYDPSQIQWDHDVLEGLLGLYRAKPSLRGTSQCSSFPWPDTKAPLCFPRPAC